MKKLFSIFVTLLVIFPLWASNVITYTATSKLEETTQSISIGLHTNAFNVSITDHTFSNGTGTITFSGEVTSIGDKAFYYCSGLTSITIPDGVTSIGSSAFSGCSGLTSITIPNSVTSIGSPAFSGCSGLTSMIVDANNSTYDSRDNCNGIVKTATNTLIAGCKNTIIPNSVTSIGEFAFYNCSGLTSVTIGDGVTSIGKYAFKGCSGLTSVNIGNSVTSIESSAFSGCSGLTSITIPDSVTTIGGSAFEGCSGLTSITIPESVEHVHPYAFYGCSSLTSVVWNARNIASSDLIINNQVYSIFDIRNPTITSFVFGENVLVIPPYLCGNQPIQTITIPASVNTIHYFAFAGCTSLTSITCEATSIPYGAYGCFDDISSSVPVYVPCALAGIYPEVSPWNTFTNIQSIAGSSCERRCGDNLYWDYADSTLTITGTGAMYDFDYPIWDNLPITTVSLPDGLTHIGDYAFFNGSRLTTVAIPNSVLSIGKHAFQQSGITSISLPSSLANIDTQAFASCIGLTSITIPNSVKSIGIYAFLGCNNLTSITIPETVEHVFAGAFEACYSLESVTWNAPNIPSSDLTFDNIIYPIFGEQGMSITSFVLGEGVVNIPVALCYNLPIQQITIPASVELVDSYAFAFCSNLTSITCKASVPPTCGNYTFHNVSTSIPVYVPCTSVAAYQTAAGWSVFTNIQPIEGSCDAEEITDPVEEVVVEPAVNTVTITWPNVLDADTYVLEISKNGELVCRLTFNSTGQLINIAFAPSRNGVQPDRAAQAVVGGWQFTVTSLESGTLYDYALIAKNGQQVVVTHTGSFRTSGMATATTDAMQSGGVIKFLRNDQIFIQRGNRLYDLRGQEVK